MTEPTRDHTDVDRELSDVVVRILRRVSGRGATKARGFVNGDIAVVVLSDLLTEGERNLVDRGHGEEVKRLRLVYQRAMSDELVPEIERLLGRRVEAFMSANHVNPDHGVEVFVLAEELQDRGRTSTS